jgi:hypothetical protein
MKIKRKRNYRIVCTTFDDNIVNYYKVYVHTWLGWVVATMHGYGNMFTDIKDARHYIKMHSGEIPEYNATIIEEIEK